MRPFYIHPLDDKFAGPLQEGESLESALIHSSNSRNPSSHGPLTTRDSKNMLEWAQPLPTGMDMPFPFYLEWIVF